MPSFVRNGYLSVLLLILVTGAASFGVAPPKLHHGQRLSRTKIFGIRCEDKFYQLEEREDKETCTTELYLNGDRTVEIRETDGPPFSRAEGYWEVAPNTNDFTMVIHREYVTGKESTDMGEFAFQVSRSYSGEMTMVGESVAITGVMKGMDADDELLGLEQPEVGFFNMIDGTQEKLSYEEAAEKLVERMQKEAAKLSGKAGGQGGVDTQEQRQALDPDEVFASLPLAMQEAFQARDLDALNQALIQMPPEEQEWHMERCIASGLWVA